MPVPPSPASRRPVPRDQGAALVLTLFATTLAMIVGTTILSVTVGNLRSARLSQDAAAALDAADAGLAQASSHLRTHGVAGISCSPGCPSGYGSQASPTVVNLPGGSQYRVWVEALAPLPAHNPGRYVVHSTGRAGDGVREIEAEVSIGTRPLGLPLALFARSFDGGGTGAVFQESILTTGCVWSRGHLTVSGTDVAYDIPAAVHSSQYVSESNGGNSNCGPSSKAIHKDGPCNASYPHDQSVQGGAYPTGHCKTLTDPYPTYYEARDLNGDGSPDVQGSRIKDEASLRKLFSIPGAGLHRRPARPAARGGQVAGQLLDVQRVHDARPRPATRTRCCSSTSPLAATPASGSTSTWAAGRGPSAPPSAAPSARTSPC